MPQWPRLWTDFPRRSSTALFWLKKPLRLLSPTIICARAWTLRLSWALGVTAAVAAVVASIEFEKEAVCCFAADRLFFGKI